MRHEENASARFGSWSRDSLVFRMTSMVIGISVLSLLLHMAIIFSLANLVTKDLSAALGSSVRGERRLLASARPENRESLAAELTRPGHIVERRSAPPPPRESNHSMSSVQRMVLSSVQQEVGSDVQVLIEPLNSSSFEDAIGFEFTIDGQAWRILNEPHPPLLAAVGTGVGWVLLIALGVTASLVFGVRLVARPLSELGQQLRQSPGGLQTLKVPAGAGSEVRDLVLAFNVLANAILQAETAKQELLAGVSHDLRTPLTRLRFRIETECDRQIADELGKDLRAIERIVSQFLRYVQGDSDAAQGEPWELAEIVSVVVDSYADRKCEVIARKTDVGWTAPDLAIQRALTNMIDNAIAYGRPPVDVTLTRVEDAVPQEVRLTVWDHGEGMSATDFSRAVRPFVRLGSSDVLSGHCGLGLAIVKQVADHTNARLVCDRDSEGRFGISLIWSGAPDDSERELTEHPRATSR